MKTDDLIFQATINYTTVQANTIQKAIVLLLTALSIGCTTTKNAVKPIDDKDLQIGDELEFINKETFKTFGNGKIISLKIKTLSTLDEEDWVDSMFLRTQFCIGFFKIVF